MTEAKHIAKIFNNHYINIVKKSSGIKPVNIAAITVIKEAYKNHPSAAKIKEIFGKNTAKNSFKFHLVKKSHVATILKRLILKNSKA